MLPWMDESFQSTNKEESAKSILLIFNKKKISVYTR